MLSKHTSSFAEVLDRIELRQLRYVAAVAESGSIVGASRVLRIAQPSVSRTIQSLEEQLGVSLFERRARGVAPTAYGLALVRHLRIIEADLRHAADDLGEIRGVSPAEIRVGVGPVESAIMSEALTRFTRRHATTKVLIREGLYAMLEPALIEGALDFIVGGGGRSSEPPAGLSSEMIGRVQPAVVVRRQHPLARKARISFADLQRATWVLPHGSGAPYDAFVEVFTKRGLEPPHGRIQAATTSWTALGFVLRNNVVALLPHQLIQHDLEAGSLRELAVGDDFYTFPVYLVTREGAALNDASRALLEEIRAVAHALSGAIR
jgi:DNA-binding transcriptional LysR family regulator